jgi:hypothetical protein
LRAKGVVCVQYGNKGIIIRTDIFMDKKVKKKAHVLRQRIQNLQQQLAGARKQMDDKDELKSLEQQLLAAESELAKIKEE